MTPQEYKEEVQPGEKTPDRVENTADAYKYPPQQKKSKPYMVWFKRAGVCVGVGLLSIVMGFVIAFFWMTNFLENALGILMVTFVFLPLFALVGGVAFFLTGLLVYRTDRKSR
jgi:hypothetical protein